MVDLPTNNGKIVYPDYNNSLVNLTASILSAYETPVFHAPLKQIDTEELKSFDNIVLMIFDGLGLDQFDAYKAKHSSVLDQYQLPFITSVCPASTPSALTSIMTGKTPLEHGILGWILFFKEFGQYIEILPMLDHADSEMLRPSNYDLLERLKMDNIYQQINRANPQIELYKIVPLEIANSYYTREMTKPGQIYAYREIDRLFKKLTKIITTKSKKKKFIHTYSTNPDLLSHVEGAKSPAVMRCIGIIEKQMETMLKKIKGTNTAILMTSDHGLIDIEKTYLVNDDSDIYDSMIMPTFPEKRFFSFFVKKHREAIFNEHIQKYKDDFLILNREDFFASGLLGKGIPNKKIDDFIGDTILIATSTAQKQTVFEQRGHSIFPLKAHHAGLTREEMILPLFYIKP